MKVNTLRSASRTVCRAPTGRGLLSLGAPSPWTNVGSGRRVHQRATTVDFVQRPHREQDRQRRGGGQAGCHLQGRKYHAFFIFNKNILIKMTVHCLLRMGAGGGSWAVGGMGRTEPAECGAVTFPGGSATNPGLGSVTCLPYFHTVLSEHPKAGVDGDSTLPILSLLPPPSHLDL